MTLKTKHIRLAKDDACLAGFIDRPRKPWEVETYADLNLENMGYRYVYKKGRGSWKARRMSMALYRVIRWGVGFRDRAQFDRARDKMHELCHARQRRTYPNFLARYIFDPRFRWAMEAQAYRESMRAMRSMGLGSRSLEAYAQKRASMIIDNYYMVGRRLKKSIRKNTAGIVRLK